MNTFYLDYNVSGPERKRLVNAIAAYTQADAKYLGAPTFAYEVDYFHIDRNGCVSFDDRTDSEEIEGLIETLVSQGFVAQVSDLGCREAKEDETANDGEQVAAEPDSADKTGLTISLPLDGFSADSLDRLQKLVDSKATLIKKALGADRMTIQASEDTVRFPWWDTLPEPEETGAYTAFIAALCKMAKEATRVTATEKEVESEKYAFRGFLLRLGFIGADSKAQRKILLKNLSGSAAFPNKEKADAFSAAQKAKRDAGKTAAAENPGEEVEA
jgi:hypothetical protein